jgi:hypothetical protein
MILKKVNYDFNDFVNYYDEELNYDFIDEYENYDCEKTRRGFKS